MGLLISYLYII